MKCLAKYQRGNSCDRKHLKCLSKCERWFSKFRPDNFDFSDSYQSGRFENFRQRNAKGVSRSKPMADNRKTI